MSNGKEGRKERGQKIENEILNFGCIEAEIQNSASIQPRTIFFLLFFSFFFEEEEARPLVETEGMTLPQPPGSAASRVVSREKERKRA